MTYQHQPVEDALKHVSVPANLSADDKDYQIALVNDMRVRHDLANVAEAFMLKQAIATKRYVVDLPTVEAAYSILFALGVSVGRHMERQSYQSITEILGEESA